MVTTASSVESGKVRIGRVFQRAISTVSHNPAVVLGLAVLIGGIPGLVMTIFLLAPFQAALASPAPDFALFTGMMGTLFLTMLVAIIVGAVIQAGLTRATVAESEGRKASFGECLSTGFSVLLPLIGLMILWWLGLMLGMMLLVVPGLILLLMWSVAVPSLVEERRGIIAAFGRSRALTKGHRWKIFGILLIIIATYFLVSLVLRLVGLSTLGGPGATDGLTVATAIGTLLMSTFSSIAWGTVQPSLYIELRNAKDGDPVGNLQQVFA